MLEDIDLLQKLKKNLQGTSQSFVVRSSYVLRSFVRPLVRRSFASSFFVARSSSVIRSSSFRRSSFSSLSATATAIRK